MPERETVLSYGGKIEFLPFHPGRSTSELIARISRAAQEDSCAR
jgi:bifunctional ADP-heptose synthase (sugar kinase/adenylyltransferase)